MGKITLDPETTAAVRQAPGDAKICDPDGQRLGYFVRPGLYEAMKKAALDWAFSEITEDDCRRALANPKRHTMDEVWKLFEDA